MAAYMCDRCGDLFKRECVPDVKVVIYHHGYGEFRQELCPKCQKELETWLREKKRKDDDE